MVAVQKISWSGEWLSEYHPMRKNSLGMFYFKVEASQK
ncbi:hypothetical protein ABIC76_005040 [Ralstonia sp. 1138]